MKVTALLERHQTAAFTVPDEQRDSYTEDRVAELALETCCNSMAAAMAMLKVRFNKRTDKLALYASSVRTPSVFSDRPRYSKKPEVEHSLDIHFCPWCGNKISIKYAHKSDLCNAVK